VDQDLYQITASDEDDRVAVLSDFCVSLASDE
jgi:hypothetical protein